MNRVAIIILALLAWLPAPAFAQSFTTMDNIIFGDLRLSAGTGVVEIGANGVVVFGNENVLNPGVISEGRYMINGTDGTIDIAVTNVSTCDAGVTFTRFPALWRGQHFANILTTPIVGAVFQDGDELSLGARINYSNDVAQGLCPADFDLTVTVY